MVDCCKNKSVKLLEEYHEDENLKHILDCYKDVYGRGIDAYYESESMDNEATSMNIGIFHYEKEEMEFVVNYRYVDTCNIEEAFEKFIHYVLSFWTGLTGLKGFCFNH